MPKLIILQWLRKNKINSISSVYFDLIWLRFFSGTGEWETCPLLITVWIHWKNIRTISNVSLELQSSFLPSTKLRSQLHKARHAPFVVEEEKKKSSTWLYEVIKNVKNKNQQQRLYDLVLHCEEAIQKESNVLKNYRLCKKNMMIICHWEIRLNQKHHTIFLDIWKLLKTME